MKQPPRAGPAPRGRRVLRWALAALLSVLVLAGLGVGLLVYPWLKGPSEPAERVDARWQAVEQWASVPESSAAGVSPLEIAAEAFRSYQPGSAEPFPTLDAAELLPAQRAAIVTLERWAEGDAALPPPVCEADAMAKRSPMSVFKLGRVALHSATGVEHLPRVKAVFVLARQLRQRGLLVDLAVGAELAADVGRWSQARSVHLPPEFEPLAPRVVEIHSGLARDVTCWMRLADDQLATATSWTTGPPFGLWSAERELRVYKDFHGRVLEQLYPARDDWRRMAQIYEEAAERRPKSLLLESTLVTPSLISSVGKKIDAFASVALRSAN